MNIIVYCGASKGNKEEYQNSAIQLGEWIAKNNHSLVFGGGNAGLMGILANTVIHNNGKTIGVMPTFLQERELAHDNLDELIIVESMSERKETILEKGDVCIALPVGPGTLEEITEVVSWTRVGQNDNPCIFFNTNHYYTLIQQFYDQMVSNGFLTQADRDKILFSNSFEEIEDFIKNYKAPKVRSY
ncbi:TIGR00730 family Rossman fold protein [Staphylococcus succinus]|nr:TIGR00730 family Rossman fold protein [Staphylococcus succinus]